MVKSACTTIKKMKNCRHPCKKVTMKTKNGKKKICKTKFDKNADPKSCSKKNKKKGKKDAAKSPKKRKGKRKTKAPKLVVESDAEPRSDPEVKEEEPKDLAQSEPKPEPEPEPEAGLEQPQTTPGNPIQGFIDYVSTTAEQVSNYDPIKSFVENQPAATEPAQSGEESKEEMQ